MISTTEICAMAIHCVEERVFLVHDPFCRLPPWHNLEARKASKLVTQGMAYLPASKCPFIRKGSHPAHHRSSLWVLQMTRSQGT